MWNLPTFVIWLITIIGSLILYWVGFNMVLISSLLVTKKNDEFKHGDGELVVSKNSWHWRYYCWLWRQTKSEYDKVLDKALPPEPESLCKYSSYLMWRPLMFPLYGLGNIFVGICMLIEFLWKTVIIHSHVPSWGPDPEAELEYQRAGRFRYIGLWIIPAFLWIWWDIKHNNAEALKVAGVFLTCTIGVFLVCVLLSFTFGLSKKAIKMLWGYLHGRICPVIKVVD